MSRIDIRNELIYGPLHSQRLGRFLGLNLVTTSQKVCPFNCIYYPYAEDSQNPDDVIGIEQDLPAPKKVADELAKALQDDANIDYITISGNGDPTFHQSFGRVVDRVLEVRDNYVPSADICLLSHSAYVNQERIIKAISKIDVPIMKLDVGSDELFQKINRPRNGITFQEMVKGLKKIKRLFVQTVFIDGKISNITSANIENWIHILKEIKPQTVQIFTVSSIHDHKGIKPVSKEKLQEIGSQLLEQAEIPSCIYGTLDNEI